MDFEDGTIMQTICNYCSSNLSAEACQKIQLTKTDEEFVRNLADDYILYKAFGRKDCHSKVAATMKRIGKEMEEKYQMFFNGVCTRLELNEDNVETAFQQISDEVFQDSVNWGRIVSMFVFSGKVAVKLVELHRSQRVEDVVTWLTNCIVNKQGWIDANGGWDAFVKSFPDNHSQSWVPTGLLSATFLVGLVTVVSVLKS